MRLKLHLALWRQLKHLHTKPLLAALHAGETPIYRAIIIISGRKLLLRVYLLGIL